LLLSSGVFIRFYVVGNVKLLDNDSEVKVMSVTAYTNEMLERISSVTDFTTPIGWQVIASTSNAGTCSELKICLFVGNESYQTGRGN
jgi:hypothetical protein